jgi:hypothetical protein
MTGSWRKRLTRASVLVTGLWAAWLLPGLGPEVARAQQSNFQPWQPDDQFDYGGSVRAALTPNFQTRHPIFQIDFSDSLQAQILDRIARTGWYEPDDLPRLARLGVLNSISMMVHVRYDVPDPSVGYRMQQEVASLWNSAEVFFQSAIEAPLDATNLARNQFFFAQLMAARGPVDSSLGGFPALSSRGAGRLIDFSQMTGEMSLDLSATEASIAGARAAPLELARDRDAMRTATQVLANDLVGLIEKLKAYDREKQKRTDAAQQELNVMLARVQNFAETIPLELSVQDLQESYRAAWRQMGRVEAEINQLDFPADARVQWRRVRERANAISDEFGLPRVIELAPNPAPPAAANPISN